LKVRYTKNKNEAKLKAFLSKKLKDADKKNIRRSSRSSSSK